MTKYGVFFIVLFCCVVPARAQLQKFCLPGVAPTHNVTSFELTPSTLVTDRGNRDASTDTLTAKLYYAFSPDYNIGAEVPLARYQTDGRSVKGLGDVLLSAQAVHSVHRFDWGVRLETFLPTASNDALGTGKWVMSPSVFAVYPFNPAFFIAAGYKQYFSAAGDGGRDDVNYGRVRMVISYMDQRNWWVTFEPQYYMDYKHTGQAELIWEGEAGVFVNEGTALYIKPGTHVAGNWKTRDWSLNVGFKILYL